MFQFLDKVVLEAKRFCALNVRDGSRRNRRSTAVQKMEIPPTKVRTAKKESFLFPISRSGGNPSYLLALFSSQNTVLLYM